MKSKTALLGLLAAAICVAPVVARGGGTGAGAGLGAHGNPHSSGVLATGVLCDDDVFFDAGGVARWVSNHNTHWKFSFGSTNGSDDQVGLRLEAGNLPANNFGFDWDTTNSNHPDILIYLTNSSGEFEYDVYDLFNLINNSSGTGFTVTNIGGNVYRVKFTAANATTGKNGPIPSGTKWNNIFVYEGDDEDGIQTLSNVFVNDHSVVPNTNPIPQSDCTPFDFSGGSGG